MDNRPIGVFDSGSGGLSTVRALSRLLPQEEILYLGDTARMPYGGRTPEEIALFSREITDFLLWKNCKAVIAACGTISSNYPGLSSLPVPTFNVIDASAKAAAKATKNGKIGLAATDATIKSGAFARAIEQESGKPVTTVACPLLAGLIESGADFTDPRLLDSISCYTDPFLQAGADTVVLGCTHYPLITPAFRQLLGKSVTLIDSGAEAAKAAAAYLTGHNLLRGAPRERDHFYFTANPAETARRARLFLAGRDIQPETELLPLGELTGGSV